MQKFVYLFISAMLLTTLVSCDRTEEPEGAFAKGVFVTNEGLFQTGTGTITHFDPENNTATQDIYGKANLSAALGNIVQSMTIVGDEAYIVVNNANKIMVVDANTFQFLREITGFTMPRYVVASANRVYVSEWGTDGINGAVKIVNPLSSTILKTIPTGQGAENMLLDGDKLYVCNSGGFGRDSTVVVISTTTEAIVQTIQTGDNPRCIVNTEFAGKFVLCSGYADWIDPTNNTLGSIWPIGAELPIHYIGTGSSSLVSMASGKLFYLDNGYLVSATATEKDTISQNDGFYGLGFDLANNLLYVADAADFQSNGSVQVWEPTLAGADSITTFQAGIIPSGFAFKQN